MSELLPHTLRYVLEYEPLPTKLAYLRLWMEEGPKRGEQEIHELAEALDWAMSRDRPSQLSLVTEEEREALRDHAVALAQVLGTADRADLRFHLQRREQALGGRARTALVPLPLSPPPHGGENLDRLLQQLEAGLEVDAFRALSTPGHNLMVLYRLLLPRLPEATAEQQERFLRFLENPRLRSNNPRELHFLSRHPGCYRSRSFCERLVRQLPEPELAPLLASLPAARESADLLVAAGSRYGLARMEHYLRELRQTDSEGGWRARLARLLVSEHAEIRLLALRLVAPVSEPGPAEATSTPAPRRSHPSRG